MSPSSAVLSSVSVLLMSGAIIGNIGLDGTGREQMGGEPDGASEWEISIPYLAQFDVNGQPICTEGTIRLRGNGTWYMRLTILGERVPVIELAGDHSSPVGIIRETIEATIMSSRTTGTDESGSSS